MADQLLHVGAVAQCPHGGQVSIQSGNTRVKVGGQAVALQNDTYTISACPFQIPTPGGPKPQPCVIVRWVKPALRVKVNGQPVILKTSIGLCQSAEQIPQGPPNVTTTQMRVKGI
jgi:uncharacterized Zn-binding protein involved in type VI secretion